MERTVNETFFDSIDTEEKAYWLGFLTADGNVYGTRVQVNLTSRDGEHLRRLSSDIGLSNRIRQTCKRDKKSGRVYYGVTVAFRSVRIVESLARLGVVPRKSDKAYPWSGPDYLMRHYWRGLVDGDGWVREMRGNIAIGLCGTWAICIGFRDFVRSLVGGSVEVRPYRNIYVVEYTCAAARALAIALYEDSAVALDRKKRLALELARVPHIRTGRPSSLSDTEKQYVVTMAGSVPVREIASKLSVTPAVIYGVLKRANRCLSSF